MSKIQIKKNAKPEMKQCIMMCDKKLHPKLDNYELTKFLNNNITNLFLGKPGSGKTSLLYSLFENKKLLRCVYHNIFLFQPTPSRASMKDDIFDEIPDDQKYDELTVETLSDCLDKIKEEPEYNHAIIFDDMGAHLRDTSVKKLLKEIIFNRRHMHISIYFLCQTYLSLEPDIRKLFSNLFIFRVSKMELSKVFEELVESHKDQAMEISKIVFDEPHNFLFINTDSQRLFKNFDELIID